MRLRRDEVEKVINGFRWVGNNLHNRHTLRFVEMYDAALEDARQLLGDDWHRLDLADKSVTLSVTPSGDEPQ